MGRRYDQSAEEIRAAIIDTAYRHISLDGYSALSARKIAKAIGYTPGTLYSHFDGLDDIALHVKSRILHELRERVVSPHARKEGAALNMALEYVRFVADSPNLYVFLTMKPVAHSAEWYLQDIAQTFAALKEALHFSESYSENEKDLAVRTLWASLNGICQASLSGMLETIEIDSANAAVRHLLQQFKGVS